MRMERLEPEDLNLISELTVGPSLFGSDRGVKRCSLKLDQTEFGNFDSKTPLRPINTPNEAISHAMMTFVHPTGDSSHLQDIHRLHVGASTRMEATKMGTRRSSLQVSLIPQNREQTPKRRVGR